MWTNLAKAAALLSFTAAAACSNTLAGGDLIRPGEPTGIIEVVNGTSVPLNVVLISDCNNFTYGFNRLADGQSISRGSSYSFRVSAGCWDVDAGAIGSGEARQRMNVIAGGIVRYTVTD